MTIRMILADDHKIMRKGLISLLKDLPDIEVVGEAEEGREAINLARELSPDIIIMDVTMPSLNGMEATRQLISEMQGLNVIALSMHRESRFVVGMLEAGAKGYLLKDCDFEELIQAIRTVAGGRTYLSPEISDIVVEGLVNSLEQGRLPSAASFLTPREREVMQLLAEGFGTREIAERLYVSVKTVESHRQNIMQKLHLKSLPELTKFALREGITSLDE